MFGVYGMSMCWCFGLRMIFLAGAWEAGRRCLCAHPQTRRRLGLSAVIDASQQHDSTGSTVATFLTQDDLTRGDYLYNALESIAEDSD